VSLDFQVLNKQAYEKSLGAQDLLSHMCQNLFAQTKFKVFMRGRFLLDDDQICSKVILFSTHPEISQWIFFDLHRNGEDLNHSTRNIPLEEYSYFLYSIHDFLPNDAVLRMFKERFYIAQGILVRKRFKYHIDFWTFYIPISDAGAFSLTASLMQSLQKWIEWFEVMHPFDKQNHPVKHWAAHDYSFIGNPLWIQEPSLISNNLSSNLSPRQMECFRLIGQGSTLKEAANVLGLSQRTVEAHVNHLKQKTGALFKSDLIKLYHNTYGRNVF